MATCSCDHQRLMKFGHERECAHYAPALIPGARKRRKGRARVARSEYLVPWLGAVRKPQPKHPNRTRPSLPKNVERALLANPFGGDVTQMIARSWYKPHKPKPVNRRERRGQTKPR